MNTGFFADSILWSSKLIEANCSFWFCLFLDKVRRGCGDWLGDSAENDAFPITTLAQLACMTPNRAPERSTAAFRQSCGVCLSLIPTFLLGDTISRSCTSLPLLRITPRLLSQNAYETLSTLFLQRHLWLAAFPLQSSVRLL